MMNIELEEILVKSLDELTPLKTEFLNKYRKLIPLPDDQLTEAFDQAVVIFFANCHVGKITKLQAPFEKYIFAIAKRILNEEA